MDEFFWCFKRCGGICMLLWVTEEVHAFLNRYNDRSIYLVYDCNGWRNCLTIDVFLGLLVTVPCERCGKKYKHIASLYRHAKFECGKEPQFKCPEEKCYYRCKQPGNLRYHCLKKHDMVLDKTFFKKQL